MSRYQNRATDALRPIRVTRHFTKAAPGSVLLEAGYDDGSPRTVVLCTASVDTQIPPWLRGQGRGWVTAEYAMLPGSTSPRKTRERAKVDGRSQEIQRLIGRSLRTAIALEQLGERLITIDCDVLEANGGTRTLAISGGMMALTDAIQSILPELEAETAARVELEQYQVGSFVSPLVERVAAISVGIVDGQPILDLDYSEDSRAEVDMNVVMTQSGRFVEIQATGEKTTFDPEQLTAMLALARKGIFEIFERMEKI